MKTFEEVYEWMAGAGEHYDDVCEPVCQMFFRWVPSLKNYSGGELACGASARHGLIDITLQPGVSIALPIKVGEPAVASDLRSVDAFGAQMIAPGLWTLTPSLNVPELIHGFAILYDVPQPAPWEQLVVPATDQRSAQVAS